MTNLLFCLTFLTTNWYTYTNEELGVVQIHRAVAVVVEDSTNRFLYNTNVIGTISRKWTNEVRRVYLPDVWTANLETIIGNGITATNLSSLTMTSMPVLNVTNRFSKTNIYSNTHTHSWKPGCGYDGCLAMHNQKRLIRHCTVCKTWEYCTD